ncbi:MAG: type II toxin-antitoxin system VapC family toxin [Promethearchaeota archaeon]
MRSNLNLIIIDSNFVLLPFQFKIDYLNEIRQKLEGNLRFIIFQQILNELEAKKRRESKSTKFSSLLNSGLLYLEKNQENYDFEFMDDLKKENESTDDFLLRKLIELKKQYQNVYIATNDSELRRRSKKLSISVIFLRQKKYISLERT